MTSKLDHALALAQKGFRVFPLIPNGKTPAVKDWPEKATTDVKRVTKWWSGRFAESNIGVATGHGLVVLDVDVKNGAKGAETFAALDMLHDIPNSYTVNTPTGGKHVYLRTEQDVRNSASKLGPGLDVRGAGGFVVGPGSTIGDQAYAAVEHGAALDSIPASIRALTAEQPSPASGAALAQASRVELDTPAAQQRASQYLSTAEPAVEGAGGDAHTFAVACAVKDFGISPETAFELMGLLWNDRCSPPWQPEDLQQKIHNAYAHGSKPIGINDPSMDFEPVQLLGNSEQVGNRLYLEFFDDIIPDVDATPLIEDYLDKQAFSVIYGESHTGKTFVALDMCAHIAAGRPWNGKGVEQGGVVYVAAEGGKGIRKRISALKKHFHLAHIPLAIVPCSVNLLGRQSDVKPLVSLVDQAALAMKTPVALVVIDTLSRAMAGANENSSEDMTAFVEAVDKIRGSTNAHVMVVHHAGKDTAKGARGHSSLRAATDTELEVADNALTVRKQRDGEHNVTLAFALKTVEVGQDRRGKAITSCVVRWAQPGDEFNGAAVTRDEQNFLMAVKGACEAAGEAGEGGVSMENVLSAYRELGGTAVERTVRRGLVSLESKGAVKRVGSQRWARWIVA